MFRKVYIVLARGLFQSTNDKAQRRGYGNLTKGRSKNKAEYPMKYTYIMNETFSIIV